ncbi:MAG: SDR family NAD(P)-dependent oxidoreductase [Gaiellaceae bacterium]
MGLLAGKAALVTGGARGNGAGIGRGLAEHGADVVLADIDGDAVVSTASEIADATGRRVAGILGDVGNPADAEAMADHTVSELGRIDILVNNAGIFEPGDFLEMSLESWERVLRVNLTGSMLVAQAAARRMAKSGGGSIINVTSIGADKAFAGTTSYGASKGGLQMATRCMALDVARARIRVNAIAPGFIKTAMTEPLYTTPETVSMIEEFVPMDRMGVPADLAGTVVYLASDLAEYVTGETITVDGGVVAGFASWRSD